MAMNLNKPKNTGVQANNPLTRISRIQFNHDPQDAIPAIDEEPAVPAKPASCTVIVDFFIDQAAMDINTYYHQQSFQIDETNAMENIFNVELKKLDDFDAAV